MVFIVCYIFEVYFKIWKKRVICFSRIPNSNRAPKLITIAQSFFKSGLPFSHDRSAFIDEDLDEIHIDDGPQHKTSSEFNQFVADALNDAIISLWPESRSMTFPRFLANNKYYETLRVGLKFKFKLIFKF